MSSPFFAGSGRSAKEKKKLLTRSYVDSPTVPEGTAVFKMEGDEKGKEVGKKMGLRDVREEKEGMMGVESNRDSGLFKVSRESGGVTYSAAQEGTRQLRSFIKSRILGGRSRGSRSSLGLVGEDANPTDGRGSRFTSAASIGVERGRLGDGEERERDRNMGFDDYVVEPEEHSEASWETQVDADANADVASEDNVLSYYLGAEEDEEEELPRPDTRFRSLSRQVSSRSLPSSPMVGVEMSSGESPRARFVE